VYFERLRQRLLAGGLADPVGLGLRREVHEYLTCLGWRQPNPAAPISCVPERVWQTVAAKKLARACVVEMDQSPLDDLSTRWKAGVIARCIGEGDSLLCLGDNDMLSVPLSYLPTLAAVTVVDVDRRVLSDIGETASPEKVSLVRGDFRDSVADGASRYGTHQLVACDPPYTESGFRLYLRLAVGSLELSGELFLTYPDMELEAWNYDLKLAIQDMLCSGGLVIEEVCKHTQTFGDPYGIVSSLLVARKVAAGEVGGEINLERLYTIR
jgi:Branched-chain polyamine synthase A C-terminal domain